MLTRRLPITCPSCESKLHVTHLHCENCETKIEGSFLLPSILDLTPDEQYLMLEFVRNNGHFKELSKKLDLSYPAVRSRMDRLIEKLQEI